MIPLTERVEQYLSQRDRFGTRLSEKPARILRKLADFATGQGAESLTLEQFTANLMEINSGSLIPGYKRYFYEENQLFYIDNKTYALTSQWGLDTVEVAELLCKEQDISFEKE